MSVNCILMKFKASICGRGGGEIHCGGYALIKFSDRPRRLRETQKYEGSECKFRVRIPDTKYLSCSTKTIFDGNSIHVLRYLY